MNVYVQFLGWLLLALTFIGSFRLSRYLAGSKNAILYPLLTASMITTVFIVIVDTVILATGVVAIAFPTLLVLQRLTGITVIPLSRSERPTSPDPEPVQDTATGHDRHRDPAPSEQRPILDIAGRLWNHITTRDHDNTTTQTPAQIEVTDPGDDDYWNDDGEFNG